MTFKVWAPHAASVSLLLRDKGAAVPLERGGDDWSITLKPGVVKHGDAYSVLINTHDGHTFTRRDPYARAADYNSDWCFVDDPSAFAWSDRVANGTYAWSPRPFDEYLIYEMVRPALRLLYKGCMMLQCFLGEQPVWRLAEEPRAFAGLRVVELGVRILTCRNRVALFAPQHVGSFTPEVRRGARANTPAVAPLLGRASSNVAPMSPPTNEAGTSRCKRCRWPTSSRR